MVTAEGNEMTLTTLLRTCQSPRHEDNLVGQPGPVCDVITPPTQVEAVAPPLSGRRGRPTQRRALSVTWVAHTTRFPLCGIGPPELVEKGVGGRLSTSQIIALR